MKIRDSISAGTLLLAIIGTAFAQTEFQLPRECSERQNVDPEKCVIQDGKPRAPWVHKVPANSKTQPVPAPATSPSTSAPASPSARVTPRQ